jgi:peptidoglycan/LPS O-acetylase OafA/YrhL
MGSDSKRIPTLDGWRAVAIAAVVVHHIATKSAVLTGQREPFLMSRFAMGVDIFFAISGLLITKLLLDHWKESGSIGLREFYVRRAFRILPPALCYLGMLTYLGLFSSVLDAVSCLTFWRNYLPFHLTEVYADHFWSLSLEEQFYLIWPVTLALAGRNRAPKVLFWIIMAFNVWRAVATMFLSPGPNFALRTDVRGDGLLWGCMAAFAYEQFPRFRIPPSAFAGSIAAAPVLFSSFAGASLFPVLVAVAVLATVQHPRWPVSSVLEWPPLIWIGKRSYSIYLWQQLFITYGDLKLPFWASMVVRLIGLLICAEISYVLIEKPLQRLGRRIAASWGSHIFVEPVTDTQVPISQ